MLAALWLCASGSLPAQTFTTLYLFGSGGVPVAGLVQGANGNLYGTTYGYAGEENGMIYEITPSGAFTTLHKGGEFGALIRGTDGNFYGTSFGGTLGYGWVFKITSSGTLTTLHNFGPLPSGTYPTALIQASDGTALVQHTNGTFYGTTASGGANAYHACGGYCGTIFSLSVGLGPFLETEPASGNVGAAVNIPGTNLTGATSVSFNGAAATFTVVSSSDITTIVPAGATTGEVQVVTPGATLSSNESFRVP